MVLAVPYDFDNKIVHEHFEDAAVFSVCQIKDKQVKDMNMYQLSEENTELKIAFLAFLGVTHVLCNKIDIESEEMISQQCMELISGFEGDPDKFLDKLIEKSNE